MSRYFFSSYIPSFSLLISINTIVSIVLAIAIMINLQNAHVALAHPFFVDSTPQPFSNQPSVDKVEIIFSEPIELGYSKISVIGPEGNTVDTGDAQHVTGAGGVDTSSLAVTLPPNLPGGSYTVSSTVLSAVDGHVVDYSFVFGIGEGAVASASSEGSSIGDNTGTRRGIGEDTLKDIFALEEAAARYPGYVGQIIVIGAIFATLWLWRPFRNIPWLSAILSEHRAKIDKNVIRLVLLGTGLVLGSGVAIIFVQSLSIGAGIPEAISTKFGNIWTIRMILASALLIVTVSIYRRIARRSRTARTKETTVILALGISIIFTYSLISHAAAIKSAAASSILIDFFHGIAASVWIGGLIVLAFVMVPKVIKISDNMAKASIISIMIPRFSAVAVFILGTIIITGPVLLWNLENDISLVAASWYGKILGIKLSLAAVMIAIGAYHQVISQKKATREVILASTMENKKTITRRDNDSSNRSDNDNNNNALFPFGQSTKFGRFDKTLKTEACIGIALLLMVSLMANMTLPSGEFPTYGGQSGEEDGDTSFSSSFALAQTPETKTDYSQARYIDNGNGNTVKVELLISPFAIGQNQFKVLFTNVSNSVSSPPFSSSSSSSSSSNYIASNSMTENYLTTIENATIKLTQLEEGIGPIEVETAKESPGIFVADAALSLQGTWNIQIEGQTSELGVPNIVAIFNDVFVKPKISNIISNVTEYKTPDQSLPLYPIYDESRESIWVGDSMPESGRIWQFNIPSKNYTEHQIDNVSLITVSALDPEGNIWYIDPSKSILGKYDVGNKENIQFNVPREGVISGLAMDNNQNLWMSVVQANAIVKFNSTNRTFTSYNIPTPNALPGAITFDARTNSIWFTEGIGKIAKVNPETGNITEYDPATLLLLSSPSLQDNNTLEEPTMAFPDPKTFDIYITEHEGNRITAYNQFLDTFEEYPIVNDQGLPFGMAMDKFGNLWFAQHVIDRVAALDPRTGESIEVNIPVNGSFIQYLTSDNDGNIWFAAQRASSIGSVVISPGPPTSGVDASTSTETVATTMETQEQQQQQGEKVGGFAGALISYFGLSFTDILGPLLAGGIILAALFYSKALIDLKRSMAVVTKSK